MPGPAPGTDHHRPPPAAHDLRRTLPLPRLPAPLRATLAGLGLLASVQLAAAQTAAAQTTAAQTTAAQPPTLAAGQIGLELNRLEPQPSLGAGGGCRAWLLLRNPGEEAVDPLRLDLLIFGKDGVIARRLALDVGPLPASKTLARIFDLSALPCDQIGSLLLNDLLACGPAPEGRTACLPRINTSSRVAGVGFDK
ncbi:Tat pathway signal protein [Roseomonas sp. OT10]|uniref:Tat pathway signal protein n=1 Tax=Roseomonas cutis TaxID=2897332 RepID=UPI001E6289E0|nr:Tat pathway signal protein [Roseomonas sp. OT10]UFN48673.1 Tat pathway signal protein [Roseomonas sp. OT10]